MSNTSKYENDALDSLAKTTHSIYDATVYITFVIKPFVIIFFAYHFWKKTFNICNVFFYLLFIGFLVDIFAWILVIVDGFCWDYSSNATVDCKWIDVIFVPFAHYNNSFSSFWMLVLSINRMTSVFFFSQYSSLWSQWFKHTVAFLFLAPFVIIGYPIAANYQCFFSIKCDDKNYWVFFGIVSAAGNGSLAVAAFILALITGITYRRRHKKNVANSIASPDVRLISQAGIASFICIIHYIFFAMAVKFEAKQKEDNSYKYGIIYVIINFIRFTAYPGYHFSAFFFLFIFSKQLRKQFFEFYHLLWLYKFTKPKLHPINYIASISSGYMNRIANMHTPTMAS